MLSRALNALYVSLWIILQNDLPFGKKLADYQNTQFVLAESATETTIAKTFLDACIAKHLEGKLTTEKAQMAKY